MNRLTIGLDIGGTKTAGALVNRRGEILTRIEHPTPASEGGQAVIARAGDIAWELLDSTSAEVEGIGVASGGQIDPRTGVVIHATDLLPGWKGMEIARVMQDRFHLPVRAINDGSAAALGEGRFGAAQGIQDFVCVVIGTGIGGGIVTGGKLLEGALGVAGSVGHMIIEVGGRPCNCGSAGCLETYASGTAIISRIIELADERGSRNPLVERLRSGELMGMKAMSEAVNDPLALEAIHEAGEYLGWGITSLLNLLNPAMVVVGGGVSDLGDLLLDPAREIACKHSLRGKSDPVQIVKAKLGNDAALLGAASLLG
jgi:glucokinase